MTNDMLLEQIDLVSQVLIYPTGLVQRSPGPVNVEQISTLDDSLSHETRLKLLAVALKK